MSVRRPTLVESRLPVGESTSVRPERRSRTPQRRRPGQRRAPARLAHELLGVADERIGPERRGWPAAGAASGAKSHSRTTGGSGRRCSAVHSGASDSGVLAAGAHRHHELDSLAAGPARSPSGRPSGRPAARVQPSAASAWLTRVSVGRLGPIRPADDDGPAPGARERIPRLSERSPRVIIVVPGACFKRGGLSRIWMTCFVWKFPVIPEAPAAARRALDQLPDPIDAGAAHRRRAAAVGARDQQRAARQRRARGRADRSRARRPAALRSRRRRRGIRSPRPRHDQAIGGWGLDLVDRLAGSWGVREGSTHVWFELSAATERRHQQVEQHRQQGRGERQAGDDVAVPDARRR